MSRSVVIDAVEAGSSKSSTPYPTEETEHGLTLLVFPLQKQKPSSHIRRNPRQEVVRQLTHSSFEISDIIFSFRVNLHVLKRYDYLLHLSAPIFRFLRGLVLHSHSFQSSRIRSILYKLYTCPSHLRESLSSAFYQLLASSAIHFGLLPDPSLF
jgi:hypothetical protein